MGRATDDFTRYAKAAGLPLPPAGALAGYATKVLAEIPALRAGSDGETLHHLLAMDKTARALLRWIGKPPPKPAGTPVPANHRLEQRAALRRAAMRAKPRSTVQDGWAD